VLVWRPIGFDPSTNKPSMHPALYVGGSKRSLGAIRAAYMHKGTLQIVVTNNYTSPTDGGSLDLHQHVARGFKYLIGEDFSTEEDRNRISADTKGEENLIYKNDPLYNDFRSHYNRPSDIPVEQELLLQQALPNIDETVTFYKVNYEREILKITNCIPFKRADKKARQKVKKQAKTEASGPEVISASNSEVEVITPLPDVEPIVDPVIPVTNNSESRGDNKGPRTKKRVPVKDGQRHCTNKINAKTGSSRPVVQTRASYPRLVKKSRNTIVLEGNKTIQVQVANVATKITDFFHKKNKEVVVKEPEPVWILDDEDIVISPTANEIRDMNQYVQDYTDIKEMSSLKRETQDLLKNLSNKKIAANRYFVEEYLNEEDYVFQSDDEVKDVHILTEEEIKEFKESFSRIDDTMDQMLNRKQEQEKHVATLVNQSTDLLFNNVRSSTANVNTWLKRNKVKGSSCCKVVPASYDKKHLSVVATKDISEPKSRANTVCSFSSNKGIPLDKLRERSDFNTDYVFSNTKMEKAFMPGGAHMGGLLDDAFDDEKNNCKFIITAHNELEIINVRPIKKGEQLCVAYGRDYWLHWAENNDVTDLMRVQIETYYQTKLPRSEQYTQQVANYTNWSSHTKDHMYYNFVDNHVVRIIEDEEEKQALLESDPDIIFDEYDEYCEVEGTVHTAYVVCKQDIPRNWAEALVHPVWGPGARLEWATLNETKSLAEVEPRGAREAVRNGEADVVYLFPIYEQKIKEGEVVYRVRLVGNGKTHHPTVNTYAATPSREEFLILMHLAAVNDYEIAHVDEKRALLSADKTDTRQVYQVYARLRGDGNFYSVLKALYGLKTSPADYQAKVIQRFKEMGYKRLGMCQCIFYKEEEEGKNKCIIYAYVDDFIFTGKNLQYMEKQIAQLMDNVSTTPPVWNEMTMLGMDIKRNRKKRTILVTMSKKIKDLFEGVFKGATDKELKRKGHPMPVAGYKVMDEDFKEDDPSSEFLDATGIQEYMTLVGCLVWIMGVRFDCTFVITYFTWFTSKPRVHHMNMVLHCIQYLHTTAHIPLVLGGLDELEVLGFSDASLGTAIKRKSPLGQCIRLGKYSGCIHAKSCASSMNYLNIFEGELDSTVILFKIMIRIMNELHEFNHPVYTAKAFGDNLAVVEFIQGRGFPKGVRHMQLRMWYIREQYKAGLIDLDHLAGVVMLADKLTKVGDVESHTTFTIDLMGLRLLGLTSLVGSEQEILDYLLN